MAPMEGNRKSDITDLSENGYTCFMTNAMINRSHRSRILLENIDNQK